MKTSTTPTPKKFEYERLRRLATSEDRAVRKESFLEYFEQFHEFPSFLFDNEQEIHADLWQTMQDIQADRALSKDIKKGVEQLLNRVPSRRDGR